MPGTGRACSHGLRAPSMRPGHQLHSAHIATYGERAVDVFYLTDESGHKLDDKAAQHLREQLLDAAAEAG